MTNRHIVPVPAAHDGGPVVVVEVKQTGSRSLDVQLVGCEGENPYVAKIDHRNLAKLQHKFKGSNEEWEAVLSHFLLQKQPERKFAKTLEHVSMVYALKGTKLEISIRQDVQGIKVTLGEIVLLQDAEFEIDPFEWAQTSAQAHSQLLNELVGLRTQLESKQEIIDRLNGQLEDFIKTKHETETAMLQQFMQLLNEKKRKIRDQQRLLAGVKVEKTTASAIQSSREKNKSRKAGASRASKRKAPAKQTVAEQESDEDQMEIDESKEEEQEDGEDSAGAATPDQVTDEETADEDEVSEEPGVPQARDADAVVAHPSKQVDAPRKPPPRRELPFGRPGTRSKPAVGKEPSPTDVNDEDDTDDEL